MGKQIQVAMNREDEKEFLSFLRTTADIELFETFAPSINALWCEDFNDALNGHWSYTIWNKKFIWTPEYSSVGKQAHNPEHIGWKYVSNISTAPVIQVTRSDIRTGEAGRLYWAKDFAAPYGLSYDIDQFTMWVEKIWRWIRKHGTKVREIPLEPYVLSGALREWKAQADPFSRH
jgi:hypothetical protein